MEHSPEYGGLWYSLPRVMMSSPLVVRFIDTFRKAVDAEMKAMQRRLGSFEVELVDPGREREEGAADTSRWTFRIPVPNNKLALHTECDLRYPSGECLVTVEELGNGTVTLSTTGRIPTDEDTYTLVIYPWFLYEKLKLALEGMRDTEGCFHDTALAVFGKAPYRLAPTQPVADHAALNGGQRRAVKVCGDSSLAFVWGPPGTGKTVTLGHIVLELVARGHRVLVTSTTNAAVDQALDKLAALPGAEALFHEGYMVRIGRSADGGHGASLPAVAAMLNARLQKRLNRLREQRARYAAGVRRCREALERAGEEQAAAQTDLFGAEPAAERSGYDLRDAFGRRFAQYVAELPVRDFERLVGTRRVRLALAADLAGARVSACLDELRIQEAAVLRRAKVVLATMTNMYVNRRLQEERFDTVVVDEAGMAVLPNLFYCTALGGRGAVLIGDPRQLPPIVQSDEPYVRAAMGRSIFTVTVPDPHASEIAVMLDTQYRMHPDICRLVSTLFYDGRLRSDASTETRTAIAEKGPFAGHALAVVDTAGTTVCERQPGSSSRINRKNAELCVALVRRALEQGMESVAVITPYAAQARLVRSLFSGARIPADRAIAHTVHRFQGNERDMVVFDTVDCAPLPPGVLLNDTSPGSAARNLVNVSVSRARGKLVVVADLAYFRYRAPGGIVTVMLEQMVRDGGLFAPAGF